MNAILQACQRGDSTAIHCFIEQNGHDIVHMQFDRGQTLLHHAGSLAVAQILVEHGANVNSRDNHGVTPLHKACARGDLRLVQYLVGTAGANVQALDDAYLLPVDYAFEHDRSDVADFLLEGQN